VPAPPRRAPVDAADADGAYDYAETNALIVAELQHDVVRLQGARHNAPRRRLRNWQQTSRRRPQPHSPHSSGRAAPWERPPAPPARTLTLRAARLPGATHAWETHTHRRAAG
jgi:hypothetical protein